MKTIKLYGHLGKEFGKIHNYHVNTPSEAIKLLSANYAGFESAILRFTGAGYKVILGKDSIDVDDLHSKTGQDVIKIVPVVSGEGGVGKIILGGALVLAAPYVGFLATTLFPGAMTAVVATMVGGAVSSIGMSMIMGGVAELLYKAPPGSEAAKQSVPGSFDGAVNTTRQGLPIPLGYGTLIIGSAVISAGISTVQVPV